MGWYEILTKNWKYVYMYIWTKLAWMFENFHPGRYRSHPKDRECWGDIRDKSEKEEREKATKRGRKKRGERDEDGMSRYTRERKVKRGYLHEEEK